MKPRDSKPLAKSIVLVGAGNAHLVFSRSFAMDPLPGVAVTLINQGTVIPYSAMVPACIGGEFRMEEISFDLVRMCAAFGLRLISDPVREIDIARRQVLFDNRVRVKYDIVSLGIGSIPAAPSAAIDNATSMAMRPLSRLLTKLDDLEQKLKARPRPFHFVVVGGGASGCELSLAISKRLGGCDGFRVSLIQANRNLLPQFPVKTQRIFQNALEDRGIEVRNNARVVGGGPNELVLEGGKRLDCDFALWATQAGAPSLIKSSGLAVNEQGFLRVRETLQSVSESDVFGTGDCVAFDDHPELAKSGVYAVREGRVLFENIRRRLLGRPLTSFRPQTRCLYLLNTADGKAVANYGSWAWQSRAARRLKNFIDRRWVRKFTEFPDMSAENDTDDDSGMRCGGCGSKVPHHVLANVLKDLPVAENRRVLVGLKDGDDAAVLRLPTSSIQEQTESPSNGEAPRRSDGAASDELVEVQTVDYFKSFINDPYLFGRIAALNAASDLYAMNARPETAMAIATLPFARTPIQEAQLAELMAGAAESLESMGITLTGGHTTEGDDLALGFAMTGYAKSGRLFRKGGMRAGDALILTKPLGTGALLAALMRGECKAVWFEELIAGMLSSNQRAAAILADAGIVACTDVTGFGLAGHLLEMLDAGEVSAQLEPASIPLYTGFSQVTKAGIRSSLFDDNARLSSRVHGENPPEWLFDPQTSGGLIAGVPSDQIEGLLQTLADSGCLLVSRIGEIVEVTPGQKPAIILNGC